MWSKLIFSFILSALQKLMNVILSYVFIKFPFECFNKYTKNAYKLLNFLKVKFDVKDVKILYTCL